MFSLFRQATTQSPSRSAGEAAHVPGEAVQLPDKPDVLSTKGTTGQSGKEQVKQNDSQVLRRAPVLGIIGAKGGAGSTTLAINLAVAAASFKEDVTLIDCNLQQPDVALMVGARAEFSLSDLIKRRDRLDKNVFRACSETLILREGQAINLISPPADLEQSLTTDLASLAPCLNRIRSFTEIVLLDLPKALDHDLLSLLDQCDALLLVLESSLCSIAAAQRWLGTFRELGYGSQSVGIAVNRSGGKLKHLETEVKAALSGYRQWRVPNEYSLLEQAAMSGRPLVLPNSRDGYSKAIRVIAGELDSLLWS